MGKAVELVAKSTTMDEKCARCAAIHGRLLLSTKKVDDAIAMLERARKLAADDIDAAHQLAKAYFLAGKHAEAADVYAPLVKQTGDPGLRSEYAIALMKAKRYEDAAKELKMLVEQFPEERSLLERLHEALKKAGDKKGARAVKKKLRKMK